MVNGALCVLFIYVTLVYVISPIIYSVLSDILYDILVQDLTLHIGRIRARELRDFAILYKKPDDTGEQLQRIFKDERVVVIGRSIHQRKVYMLIDYCGKLGYINANLLR